MTDMKHILIWRQINSFQLDSVASLRCCRIIKSYAFTQTYISQRDWKSAFSFNKNKKLYIITRFYASADYKK